MFYVLAGPLTFLINMSIERGLVPSDWKIAKVIPPGFKSGKKSVRDNYRPISVLPALSKCSSRNSWFLSKRSIELAVELLTYHIRKEADKGFLTEAIFIDLSKAFDTVSHSCLLKKLPSFEIYGTGLNWFTDYQFNRNKFVLSNGVASDTTLFRGVPQGSIIGRLDKTEKRKMK